MTINDLEKPILIFDGECNLCNGLVGKLLQLNDLSHFKYLAYQSPEGQQWLETLALPTDKLDTVVIIEKERVQTNSDALLTILQNISTFKTIAKVLRIVPRQLRDSIYKFAALNRMLFFGSSSSCRVVLRD